MHPQVSVGLQCEPQTPDAQCTLRKGLITTILHPDPTLPAQHPHSGLQRSHRN